MGVGLSPPVCFRVLRRGERGENGRKGDVYTHPGFDGCRGGSRAGARGKDRDPEVEGQKKERERRVEGERWRAIGRNVFNCFAPSRLLFRRLCLVNGCWTPTGPGEGSKGVDSTSDSFHFLLLVHPPPFFYSLAPCHEEPSPRVRGKQRLVAVSYASYTPLWRILSVRPSREFQPPSSRFYRSDGDCTLCVAAGIIFQPLKRLLQTSRKGWITLKFCWRKTVRVVDLKHYRFMCTCLVFI